ncbi:MAG TPA: M23 family metallopeptidase [Thermoanaerobaculia bacterium]|jgi:murein DD-endopeptidase MepM/ murein hydrolase activator NlpD
MVIAASVLALAAGVAPPNERPVGDCRSPSLTIRASPSKSRQGGIVAVTVASDVPLERAALHSDGQNVLLEKASDGKIFRGLLGIDFESTPGRHAFRVNAKSLCGDLHSARRHLRVTSGRFPIQRLEVPPAYVEPPESELERIREEKERVARVWETGKPARRWIGPFRPPIDAPIRDNFGSRRIFDGEPRSAHSGVDISAPEGTAVFAPATGTVALADTLYFSGGTVILDHGAGLFTTYFHLSRIDVKRGDDLEPGQAIGAVGATGRATGPHLHWGARLHGARINPLALRQLPNWLASPPSE